MKKLAEEFKGKIHLVVKFAPYPFRDYGRIAAKAALAARAQNAFWEMHEKLLENYRKLDPTTLDAIAGELKLDRVRFKRDLESPEFDKKVQADIDLGKSFGIYQTPTFFINGKMVVGERPIESLRKIIGEKLAEAERGK